MLDQTNHSINEQTETQRLLSNIFLGVESINSKLQDDPYYKFIRGGKIALIGPMKANIDVPNILKEFDIIVQFNFKKNQERDVPKCDISYFNGDGIESIIRDFDYEVSPKIKFANFRYHNFKYAMGKLKFGDMTFFRSELNFKLVLNLNFTGLVRALLDLHRFSPKNESV